VITGERVVTTEGGFNPTWQRHVAAYAAADGLLPAEGRVLDLGCGVGHSYALLAPRETVGVDLEPAALEGQDRTTVAADMRALPFPAGSFASVLSVHSLEHVPDPGRVVAEVLRVIAPGGTAVFVTPNRLTFGRPDEIIDPYHFVEYDAQELAALLEGPFASVEVLGLHGSERYLRLVAAEKATMERVLRLDALRLRRALPRRARQRLYDLALTARRRRPAPGAQDIVPDDFRLARERLDEALDLVAVARAPG
jgi:SAM-dependent methyltransferase